MISISLKKLRLIPGTGNTSNHTWTKHQNMYGWIINLKFFNALFQFVSESPNDVG